MVTNEEYKRRFFKKVEKTEKGCWIWKASKTSSGYGQFRFEGRNAVAHKLCYLWIKGNYDQNLDLDHLCRNRACVNPDHLEPVTRSVNLLRGDTIPAKHSEKKECPKGHSYSVENTYYDNGSRKCRECRKAYLKQYYMNSKAIKQK